MNKTFIKRLLFIIVCVLALLGCGFLILQYSVEGDKKMPFKISKILMISTVDGRKNDDAENLWNISLSQVNDLYIYVDKTDNNKDETIKEIRLDNFNVVRPSGIGDTKIFKPTGDLKSLYLQSTENQLDKKIIYVGDRIDDLKAGTISNIGGTIGFRYAIENLGKYVSNDDTEVVYNGSLLRKVGIELDKVKSTLNFDFTLVTSDKITYKGTVTVNTPAGDIGEEGHSNIEITDLDSVVFKRVKE